jgi:hypothetical protein
MLAFLKIPNDPDQYYTGHPQNLATLTGYKKLKIDKLLKTAEAL